MQKKRSVLVIEDNELNRELLTVILEDTYDVLTAENGAVGLDVLEEYGSLISLILLDIQMPVLDGYGFLQAIQREGKWIDIPIIVATASNTIADELSCLEMGASDFVTKPYNPDIVRRRAESLIRLRETSAMLHRVERDSLTGVYTRNFFLELVRQRLQNDPSGAYDMICVEIESFRLLHDRYGSNRCNAIIQSMVASIVENIDKGAIVGRFDTAQIAFLTKHLSVAEHEEAMKRCLPSGARTLSFNVTVNCGVYSNVDHNLSAELICNNALMPIDKIRNHYGRFIAEYDDSIRQQVVREQVILDCMENAIQERQFRVYYQPKYNIVAEKTGGAEALVRWIHPEMGFMNPGEFIPIFEHNGFIPELDRYVLDSVCRDLRTWIEEGKAVVPISVNVSQADFDRLDLAEQYEALVDSYHIPHELIHFEITESTHASDAMRKKNNVIKFHEMGFQIELDDFGTGYSSLGSLGEIPLDVMKLDMSLVRNMFEEKYRAILEGALYTACQLKLKAVVAEGVETKEQADALRRLCEGRIKIYIQGYYYSRPIPAAEFQHYLQE